MKVNRKIITIRGDILDRGSDISPVVRLDGEYLDEKKSLELRNHSPDGFNWGYGGSGPSQLALAILLECVDQETALAYYHDFKDEFIAPLKQGESFEIEVNIKKWFKLRR